MSSASPSFWQCSSHWKVLIKHYSKTTVFSLISIIMCPCTFLVGISTMGELCMHQLDHHRTEKRLSYIKIACLSEEFGQYFNHTISSCFSSCGNMKHMVMIDYCCLQPLSCFLMQHPLNVAAETKKKRTKKHNCRRDAHHTQPPEVFTVHVLRVLCARTEVMIGFLLKVRRVQSAVWEVS